MLKITNYIKEDQLMSPDGSFRLKKAFPTFIHFDEQWDPSKLLNT